MPHTVSFVEDIDGARHTEPRHCACANCRSEGEYEYIHGARPADCRFRHHTRCQGCDYYGPIPGRERLCPRCRTAYRAEQR